MQSRIDDHGKDDPVEESPEDRQAKNDKEDRDGGSFDDGLRAISHVPPAGDQSHLANSLFEKSTPGDVAAPTKQGQREKEFAKGEQEETSTTDETDLLDHGLTLVGHVVPLGKSHYDTEAAYDFLKLLGFDRHDPVILSADAKQPDGKTGRQAILDFKKEIEGRGSKVASEKMLGVMRGMFAYSIDQARMNEPNPAQSSRFSKAQHQPQPNPSLDWDQLPKFFCCADETSQASAGPCCLA